MKIINDEIKKIGDAFKVLEFSQKQIDEHSKKLKNVLLMDVAAEAFAEKGQLSDDAEFEKEAVEDFLLDNYEEKELEDIVQRVAADVIFEYFGKLLIGETEEKKYAVNKILKEKF